MESAYQRYAVYFAPRAESPLAEFARQWLGVDAESGVINPAPTEFVESPRRYGFHATLKAPMRLKAGVTFVGFWEAVNELSSQLQPVDLGRLEIKRIGAFLALMVAPGRNKPVSALAWRLTSELDRFRAPLNNLERDRRRGLNYNQSLLFEKWGYPYVANEFRFHMTLTSALDERKLKVASNLLVKQIPDCEVILDNISIFADPGNHRPFRLIERFDLKG